MKAWIFFFMPSVSEDTVTVTGVAGAVSWFTVMLRPGRVCLNSLVVDCTVMPLTVSSAFWAYCATEPEVAAPRSEEHTSELQSPCNLVCRLLLEKKKTIISHVLPLLVEHLTLSFFTLSSACILFSYICRPGHHTTLLVSIMFTLVLILSSLVNE